MTPMGFGVAVIQSFFERRCRCKKVTRLGEADIGGRCGQCLCSLLRVSKMVVEPVMKLLFPLLKKPAVRITRVEQRANLFLFITGLRALDFEFCSLLVRKTRVVNIDFWVLVRVLTVWNTPVEFFKVATIDITIPLAQCLVFQG